MIISPLLQSLISVDLNGSSADDIRKGYVIGPKLPQTLTKYLITQSTHLSPIILVPQTDQKVSISKS